MDKVLEEIGYYDFSEEEKTKVYDFLLFSFENNAGYFSGETTECKTPEENYKDYCVYLATRDSVNVT